MIRITKLFIEKQLINKEIKKTMIDIDFPLSASNTTKKTVKLFETIGAKSFYREISDPNKL